MRLGRNAYSNIGVVWKHQATLTTKHLKTMCADKFNFDWDVEGGVVNFANKAIYNLKRSIALCDNLDMDTVKEASEIWGFIDRVMKGKEGEEENGKYAMITAAYEASVKLVTPFHLFEIVEEMGTKCTVILHTSPNNYLDVSLVANEENGPTIRCMIKIMDNNWQADLRNMVCAMNVLLGTE